MVMVTAAASHAEAWVRWLLVTSSFEDFFTINLSSGDFVIFGDII